MVSDVYATNSDDGDRKLGNLSLTTYAEKIQESARSSDPVSAWQGKLQQGGRS